jgi:hypothetical protein
MFLIENPPPPRARRVDVVDEDDDGGDGDGARALSIPGLLFVNCEGARGSASSSSLRDGWMGTYSSNRYFTIPSTFPCLVQAL